MTDTDEYEPAPHEFIAYYTGYLAALSDVRDRVSHFALAPPTALKPRYREGALVAAGAIRIFLDALTEHTRSELDEFLRANGVERRYDA